MTQTVHLLSGGVVVVFVRNEEGGLDGAAVGVEALLEDELVQVHVVDVDGIVESDGDHLRHFGRLHVVGHLRVERGRGRGDEGEEGRLITSKQPS